MTPSAPPPGGAGGKRKKALLIGGGVLAAAALAVGAVVVTSGDEKTTSTTAVATSTAPASTGASTTAAGEPTTTLPVPFDVNDIAHSVVALLMTDADGNYICVGSGTIVSSDGLVLTNAHVVENEGPCAYDHIEVAITDSPDAAPTPTYLIDVVAIDVAIDLAVVQIARDLDGNDVTVDLPALPVGDSDAIQLGDHLRILGYPIIGGETITFTEGSVSGFASEAGVGDRAWVKTDASISGGNSGGTAINDDGQLVAIPTRASVGENSPSDCRVVQDTNGDNVIDENDSCIPIGGFINGMRPVNLALPLIEEGREGNVVPTTPETTIPVVDVNEVQLGPITFSPEVNSDDTPGEIVQSLPSGSTAVCAFFDYTGMADGTSWDALWSVDGEVNTDLSLVDQQWTGGTEGSNWWVCAGSGDAAIPDGVYELTLYVEGELIASNTVFVGSAFTEVSINVFNATDVEVCYLHLSPQSAQNWGPDDLGADTTIPVRTGVPLTVIGATYDVLAQDCELNTVAELYAVDLSSGGDLSLTND